MKQGDPISFRTRFNQGLLRSVGQRIDMEVAGATFATWHPTRLLTGYSWDVMSAATLLHPANKPLKVLLLGLAGGTMVRILRQLNPDHAITAVEIDPELVQCAETYLHFDRAACEVVMGDAYAYLARTTQRYDVILDDVFLAGTQDVYRPQHANDQLVELYQQALRPEGLVAVNCITTPPHQTIWHQISMDLKRTFPAHTEMHAARGYNCACIAGKRFQRRTTLRQAEQCFPAKQDQRWWRKMVEKNNG